MAVLAKEIARRASVWTLDLASPAEWEPVASALVSAHGPPTHVVLTAGGWQGGAPVHASKDARSYPAMMASNVDTTYYALQTLLPSMVKAGRGAIVLIGSRAAVRPESSAGAAAYAASKSAVVALAESVAREVIHFGVRINAVLPSTLDTPANRAAMPDADATRWVSLSSCAGVIDFLLSDEARDISGAALPLYGRA